MCMYFSRVYSPGKDGSHPDLNMFTKTLTWWPFMLHTKPISGNSPFKFPLVECSLHGGLQVDATCPWWMTGELNIFAVAGHLVNAVFTIEVISARSIFAQDMHVLFCVCTKHQRVCCNQTRPPQTNMWEVHLKFLRFLYQFIFQDVFIIWHSRRHSNFASWHEPVLTDGSIAKPFLSSPQDKSMRTDNFG